MFYKNFELSVDYSGYYFHSTITLNVETSVLFPMVTKYSHVPILTKKISTTLPVCDICFLLLSKLLFLIHSDNTQILTDPININVNKIWGVWIKRSEDFISLLH